MKSKPSRMIGIDFGLARIGLSISDETKCIAASLNTIKTEAKTSLTVAKLVQEIERHCIHYHCVIESIVVGIPLLMSGKIGIQADEVKHFIDELKKVTDIPIIGWDERLTTVQAERTLREGGLSRKKRSKVVDAVAAVLILQNYLDYLGFKKLNQEEKL